MESPVELKDGDHALGRGGGCTNPGRRRREMKQARQRAAVQAAAAVWEAAAAVVHEARADEIFSTFRWYVTVYVLYCKGRSRSVNLLKCDG